MCSSCLATFIDIAYPEGSTIRYIYLIFTISIGLSALITYYETLLKLLKVIGDYVELCMSFHEWFNHCIFWPSMFANLGLLGMNVFILHKYFDTQGFNSSGTSLILNVLSLLFSNTSLCTMWNILWSWSTFKLQRMP